MCSKMDERLALIGTAIDELAEAARVAAGDAGADIPDTLAQDTLTQDAMAERVAGIWAMVADLDPALAHRLSQYTSHPATGQPTTGQPTRSQSTDHTNRQSRPDPGHA
ncbi:MAG TPA: hypothetical protein VIE45_12130 [Streptosporangiaceae bacterium]